MNEKELTMTQIKVDTMRPGAVGLSLHCPHCGDMLRMATLKVSARPQVFTCRTCSKHFAVILSEVVAHVRYSRITYEDDK